MLTTANENPRPENASKHPTTKREKSHRAEDGTAKTGYQGTGKKSNDPVFEAKRSQFDKTMRDIEAETGKLRERMDAISNEIHAITANDAAKGAQNELRAKLNEVYAKRDELESARAPMHMKLKETQEIIKRRIDDMNLAKEKMPFKTTDEIDRKIKSMEGLLETGSVKLIEEKRMVAEISKMRKNRKAIEALNGPQSVIDDLKKRTDQIRAAIAEKDHELNAVRDRIRAMNQELNATGSKKDATHVKLQALFKEKDALRAKMTEQYALKSAAYEEMQLAQSAHRLWIEQDRLKREENYKRNEIHDAIRQLEYDLKKLDLPPCADQIGQCVNLANYLRVNCLKETLPSTSATNAASNGTTVEIRKVEKLDGDLVLKNKLQRDEEDTYYFVGKKGGPKGKKGAASSSTPSESTPAGGVNATFKLPFWVVTGLQDLGLGMVTSMAEVEQVVVKLDALKSAYEKEQDEKLKLVDSQRAAVQANIEKQKARLDNVAAEVAAARAANPKPESRGSNGANEEQTSSRKKDAAAPKVSSTPPVPAAQ